MAGNAGKTLKVVEAGQKELRNKKEKTSEELFEEIDRVFNKLDKVDTGETVREVREVCLISVTLPLRKRRTSMTMQL